MRLRLSNFAEIVAFCDPASGKTGSAGIKRCRTAIVVVGQRADGPAYLLHAEAWQGPTDQITSRIFAVNDEWHPGRFGIDATGQQSLYADTLIRDSQTQRKHILIVPMSMPTTETKEFRITTEVQKWLHSGLLYINEDCTEAVKELKAYPKGKTCDIVDALASALHMLKDPFASDHVTYEMSKSYAKPEQRVTKL